MINLKNFHLHNSIFIMLTALLSLKLACRDQYILCFYDFEIFLLMM